MGQDRIKQTVSLGQVAAFQVMVVGTQEFPQLLQKGGGRGGFEGIGPEEFIVVHKAHSDYEKTMVQPARSPVLRYWPISPWDKLLAENLCI